MDYGALIQMGLSVIGEFLKNGKEAEAAALYRRLQNEAAGMPLPALEDIKAQQLQDTAMDAVRTDPRLEAAQMDSLGQLGDVAESGLAGVDKATLNRLANQAARRQSAGMAGIENDMAARGLAGSGLDYGARLANASAANQQLSEEGQNVASDALQRRLQAVFGRADMAGKIRGQSFGEQSKIADARDAVNRVNAGMRERAQYYNAGLPQQQFNNRMTRLGAQANPAGALGGMYRDQGNSTGQLFAGLGAAASRYTQNSGSNSNGNSYGGSDGGYNGTGMTEDEYYRRFGGSKINSDEDK